jgi:hypothetical protein
LTETPTPTASSTGTATFALTPTPTPLGSCVEPFPTEHDCFGRGTANACLNASGGARCFDVAAPADCCWTATVGGRVDCYTDDVVITQGEAGCGDGQVCFTYRIGCPHLFRYLGIRVGDKVFSMIQDLPPTPVPTPTPTWLYSPTPVPTPFGGCVEPFPLLEGTRFRGINAVLDPAGGTQCFDVVAAQDCCWAPVVAPDPSCSPVDVLLTTGREGACDNGVVCFTYGLDTCVEGGRSLGRSIYINFGSKHFIALQDPLPTATPSPGT